MPRYLNSQEILEEREYLKKELKPKGSYFVRDGTIMRVIDAQCPPGGSILEVGTGNGWFAAELSKHGFNVSGLDIDNYVDEDVMSAFQFVRCDLNTNLLPFADNKFDCIIAPAVVEHLDNGASFLREVARVLKPGGVFLFSMPNIFSLLSKWAFFKTGDFLGYEEGNNHIMLFTRAVLKKFTHGLKQEQIYYSHGWITLFGRKLFMPNYSWFNRRFGRKLCYQFRKL